MRHTAVRPRSFAAALALLVFVGYLAQAQTSGNPPSTGTSSGSIVFSSKQEGQFDIFEMRPDGSGLVRLTTTPTRDNFPEASPNGKYFTYIAISEDYSTVALMIQAFDGTVSQPILKQIPVQGTAFSPDGIAMAICIGLVQSGQLQNDIYLANLMTGGALTKLTHAPDQDGAMPQWSPDGRQIAFASGRSGHQEIYVMDVDGGNPRQLTTLGAISGEPAWSPNGARIVFFSGTSSMTQIFTMSRDGTGLLRLTNSSGHNGHPRWSPDGQRIVFWSSRSGTEHIYTVRADGTGEQQLTSGQYSDENPIWVP
jgi:TolB protein